MIKLITAIPVIALSLASLSTISCNSNKNHQQQTQTEIVTSNQTPDTFEGSKTKKKPRNIGLWDVVFIGGIVGIFAWAKHVHEKFMDKVKNDPDLARIWLDMNGDKYLDN